MHGGVAEAVWEGQSDREAGEDSPVLAKPYANRLSSHAFLQDVCREGTGEQAGYGKAACLASSAWPAEVGVIDRLSN